MKRYLVLLLIGFMLLGLALSVLAAGPDPGGTKMGTAADDLKKLATSEPVAAKLAAVIGPDCRGTGFSFLRRLIAGVCGFLILYTRLGFAFLAAEDSVICSIGMLGYRVRLVLMSFLMPKTNEQTEVCYVS